MAIKFKSLTKHGTREFGPNVSMTFRDEGAEEYFVAAGFAETVDEVADVVHPVGTVTFNKNTAPVSARAFVVPHGMIINGQTN